MLTVAGCGKPAHLAPLVEIRQGPEGTIYTTVAALGGSHSGALEVTDPFAVCGEERVAIVNGRFLQDAIKTHDRSALRGLTGSNIRIDNGDVSVGETQVHGLDGLDEAGRDAVEEIAGIERRARHDGVTKKAARAQALTDHLAERGLGDEEAYVREYVKQGALWPLSSDDGPDAYRAFHDDVHARARDKDALLPMYDREAARVMWEYEQSGMQVPREEWLRGQARAAYQRAVVSAQRQFENVFDNEELEAKAYRESVDEWGSVRGHDMAALRTLASPPPRYEGVTGQQDDDLMLAKECLAKCGDPTWEPNVTVGDFKSELDLVAPAASSDHARPILTALSFSDGCGRRRMTATDSYRLLTSSVAVPQALAQDEHLVAADNLQAWAQHANKHLGKNQRTHLGVSVGDPSERYYGFNAGQMRVASRGVRGNFPLYEPLIPSDAKLGVSVSGKALADVHRSTKAGGDQQMLFTVRDNGSGKVQALEWQATDKDGRVITTTGSVAASTRQRSTTDIPSSAVSVKAIYFRDALRFAGGSAQDKNIGDVEMRRMDPLKPMMIVPAGSPRKLQDIDRIAIQMPIRRS